MKVDSSFQYPFFGDICDVILKNFRNILFWIFIMITVSLFLLLQSNDYKSKHFLSSIPSSIKHIDYCDFQNV